MIKFYTSELTRGWFESLNLEVRRQAITLEAACSELGYDLLCTSIFRSEEKQRALCKQMKVPYYASLHMVWNAADLEPLRKTDGERLTDEKTAQGICDVVNAKHPYGNGKVSCLWHKGTGWHFHLQANPRKFGQGKVFT